MYFINKCSELYILKRYVKIKEKFYMKSMKTLLWKLREFLKSIKVNAKNKALTPNEGKIF